MPPFQNGQKFYPTPLHTIFPQSGSWPANRLANHHSLQSDLPEFASGSRMVFLSYARKDGRDAALRLKDELEKESYQVWLDTRQIEGGASWTREIENAVNECEVLLGLLTKGSFESEVCRAEQMRALRMGKCVIPVRVQSEADIPLYFETRNWREYPEQTTQLLADIKRRDGAKLKPEFRHTRVNYVTSPIRLTNEIRRPEALRGLRETLIADDENRAVALTALEGMGGIGKTVLAQALCRDETVQAAFPDGIVWVTVGRERNYPFLHHMKEIAKALGDDPSAYENDLAAENRYRTVLANKSALVVLDDIWSMSDLRQFIAESPRSRFLFTTRDASLARFAGARAHRVDILDDTQARELLALWTGHTAQSLPGCASQIIQECGCLPLALSTIGALLRDAGPDEWRDWLGRLKRADLSAVESMLPVGQTSFFRAIEVSVGTLEPDDRAHYMSLAILLEDMAVNVPILQTIWDVNGSDARRLGRLLADRSLAAWDSFHSRLRLHDLQLDYARAHSSDHDALRLIHGAVRLSTQVLEKDPVQFASQLTGRLLIHATIPFIHDFIQKLAQGCPSIWLRPMHPALHSSGSPLLRILSSHSDYVWDVAVTQDGQRAISASWDNSLKVWDLESGRELRTLAGHSNRVYGVAITPGGQRAISASADNTLTVWDLESGRELRTLVGHSSTVYRVAVTHDGRRAVSASWDKTLKVWDLENGSALYTLAGHTSSVLGLAVTSDGQRAISGSEDRKLKVWDLTSGRELRTLEGHSDSVYCVAVTPDGQRAVSGCFDSTLKVWDLASGHELRTLEGHSGQVNRVVVTPDGQRAVSASEDNTLKVWDLESGCALYTFDGHFSPVHSVTLTPDGQRAVSASEDKTLKVWNLASRAELPTFPRHSASVLGLALTPDRKRLISASRDKTLKVWDLANSGELLTLAGHSAQVNAVAVTPEGRRAISASDDNTLKVWDLTSGCVLLTLTGHSSRVYHVAVIPHGAGAVLASWDGTLKVWDLTTDSELLTLVGHSGPVCGVAVTPDSPRAVSASWDKTLKVWDLTNGGELLTLVGHSGPVCGVAVTPDGQRAVSASFDNTLKVWDLKSGRELATLVGHSSPVFCAAVSVDGQSTISGSWDNTLMIWDMATARSLVSFHCDAPVLACGFASNGIVVAGDALGRIHFLALELPAHAKAPNAKKL